MRKRRLGTSALDVSVVGLGGNNFGGRIDFAASERVVHKAIALGVNLIDTADSYGNRGGSEEELGRILGDKRKHIVLATKFGLPMDDTGTLRGASRRYIMHAVEASLKRLRTDWIDLYQLHRPDDRTPIEETLRALDELVRHGKVRYIGCSNLPAWYLMKALAASREQRLERFKCTQSFYSLAGRDLERETIPLLKDQGLGLLVWSPLAGGFLSGKFTRDGGDDSARRAKFDFPPVNKEKGFAILDALAPIAKAHGATVPQIALAWILANEAVTSVIIGARKIPQLEDNLKAVDVTLTPDDMKALDEVSKLTVEYPAWMDALGSDRRPGERRY
jgi:aryl-alcohol dehydrogenase-like predicted oxidoreductase